MTILKCCCALTFLAATLFGTPSHAGDCPDSVESTIKSKITAFRQALALQDHPTLLSLYHPTDSALQTRISREYEDYFSLADIGFELETANIRCDRDTVHVALCRRVSYTLDSVAKYDAEWLTLSFAEVNDDFYIVNEQDADFVDYAYADLSVQLWPDSGRMNARAELTLEVLKDGPTSIILLLNRGLDVGDVSVNDRPIERVTRNAATLELFPSEPFSAGDTLNVRLTYAGSLYNEAAAAGFSQVHIGPEGCFASWVTDWYPRNRCGASKSRARIAFDVPAELDVVVNGKLTGTESSRERETHTFEVTTPLAYSFAVGDYLHDARQVDSVTVGVYFLEGGEAKVERYLDRSAEVLRYLSDLYGMYPFDSYHLVEIPSSVTGNLGGSSEQGMNLYPTGMLAADHVTLPLLAHELAHSWWGNWVHSGSGAIISEGLAQYSAVACVAHMLGEDVARQFLKYGMHDYPQSARQYFSRYTGPNPVMKDMPIGESRLAHGSVLHELADVKGHFVYVMLADLIGRETFHEGLRTIVRRYAHESLTLDDLISVMEEQSGADLAVFADQWFYRTGAPTFDFTYSLVELGTRAAVTGRITQPDEPYTVDAVIAVYGRDKRIDQPIHISGRSTEIRFEVPLPIDSILFDPDYRVFRYTPEFAGLHLLSRGTQFRVKNEPDSAIVLLSEFLQTNMQNMEAHYQLARAYQIDNRDSTATHHFQKVINLHNQGEPYHWTVPWAYVNLARLQLNANDTVEAVAALRNAIGYPQTPRAVEAAQTLLDSLIPADTH